MPQNHFQGSKRKFSADQVRVADTVTQTYAVAMATSYSLSFGPEAKETEVIALTGALVLAATNLKAGKRKTLIVTGSGGSRNITPPVGSKCLGTAPTAIASGKVGKFEFHSRGTTEAELIYTYAVEP